MIGVTGTAAVEYEVRITVPVAVLLKFVRGVYGNCDVTHA